MRLTDFLAPAEVIVPLPHESLASAAQALVERLVASGAIENAEKLERRVTDVRAENVAVMGDRAFLLHLRTDAARELRAAVGIAARPVVRKLADGEIQCARIVILVVSPARQAARFLQVVRAFARVTADKDVVASILDAKDAEALLAHPALAVELPEELIVRDLMTERCRTTRADVPLTEAARDMMRAGVGALPVVDDASQVIGMLSERELMRHLLTTQVLGGSRRPPAPGTAGRKTVRDVMTRQVLCVAPEQPVAEVAALMTNKDVERVPVVREGRLVGFLTRGDIVRKLIGP